MIKISEPSKCCGCTACYAVCPHDAITMKEDRLGFPYPVVDSDKCVECGLCEKVCKFNGKADNNSPSLEEISVDVHAVRHKVPEVLDRSQSGGAFTALSDYVLRDGGVIYGAVMTSPQKVSHVRAVTKEGRDEMCGSKYIQSDMGDVFRQVREDLRAGHKVMFTGTPCQVAGLKSYIPASLSNNLLLVDFICHGVPSPAVWKEYVKYVERQGKVVKATFRDKAAGWKKHLESFVLETGEKKYAETFRILFYKNIMLRHSCGVCPYDIRNHEADITMADFWGVEEVIPSMGGDRGTSMLVCNTVRGKEWLSEVSDFLESRAVALDYDFMARRNPNLVKPATIYKDRTRFEEEFAGKGFVHVARKWGDLGIRYKLWKLKKWFLNFMPR